MRDSTQRYLTVGVLAAALLLTVTLTGGFVGLAAAQTAPTVEESTVDADGSQITVRTGGSASVAVDDLPAGSSVGDVSDGGSYNADDGSISWFTLSDGLPETVTFTLTPPEGRDTVQFTLDDGTVENTVALDVSDSEDARLVAELPNNANVPSTVTNGESIIPEVTIRNTGGQTSEVGRVSVHIEDVDGNTVTEGETELIGNLGPNETQETPLLSGTIDVSAPGNYSLVFAINGVDKVSQSLRITDQDPAVFNITSTATTSPVTAGEALSVSIGVANTGGQEDTKNVAAGISGIETVDQAITLAPGENTTVDLSIQTTSGDAGEYPVVISAGEDTAYPPITINPSNENRNAILIGTISDLDQNSISGVEVTLQRQTNAGDYVDIATDTTGTDGSYTFTDLTLDEVYRVTAEFEGAFTSVTIDDLSSGTNTRDIVIFSADQEDPSSPEDDQSVLSSATRTVASDTVTPGGTIEVTVETTLAEAGQPEFQESIQREGANVPDSEFTVTEVPESSFSAVQPGLVGIVSTGSNTGTVTLTYEISVPDTVAVGSKYTITGSAVEADTDASIDLGTDTVEVVDEPQAVPIGGTEVPAKYTTTENGEPAVSFGGLSKAAADFRNGDVGFTTLSDVAAGFRNS